MQICRLVLNFMSQVPNSLSERCIHLLLRRYLIVCMFYCIPKNNLYNFTTSFSLNIQYLLQILLINPFDISIYKLLQTLIVNHNPPITQPTNLINQKKYFKNNFQIPLTCLKYTLKILDIILCKLFLIPEINDKLRNIIYHLLLAYQKKICFRYLQQKKQAYL